MNKLTIQEKLVSTFKGKEGRIFSWQEIIDRVITKFPDTNRTSILPSDNCYNITNNGIKFETRKHLFKYLERNKYECLGENVAYNGKVLWKGEEFGEWIKGKFNRLHK